MNFIKPNGEESDKFMLILRNRQLFLDFSLFQNFNKQFLGLLGVKIIKNIVIPPTSLYGLSRVRFCAEKVLVSPRFTQRLRTLVEQI